MPLEVHFADLFALAPYFLRQRGRRSETLSPSITPGTPDHGRKIEYVSIHFIFPPLRRPPHSRPRGAGGGPTTGSPPHSRPGGGPTLEDSTLLEAKNTPIMAVFPCTFCKMLAVDQPSSGPGLHRQTQATEVLSIDTKLFFSFVPFLSCG